MKLKGILVGDVLGSQRLRTAGKERRKEGGREGGREGRREERQSLRREDEQERKTQTVSH